MTDAASRHAADNDGGKNDGGVEGRGINRVGSPIEIAPCIL